MKQKIKPLIRTLLLSLTTVAAARAQERLTLGDAIDRALQHNFDIRIARNVTEQAQANNTWGNAGALPNVNLNGNLTGSNANTLINFADGRTQENRNANALTYGGGASLNWTLFDGGRMFLVKKQLGREEELSMVQQKDQVQTVVAQVVQAYAQAVWQKQQGIAIDTGLVLAQTRMVLSQLKFETGSSAKVDFLQARVDYNARQSDSLNQEAALVGAFASLNALMGENEYKTYEIDDSLSLATNLEPADRERLKDINLSLDIARRSAELSQLDAKVARTSYLPTLALNGGYNYTRTRSESGFALFNRSYGPNGALNLSVPLYQGGNIRRQAKVAGLEAFRNQLLYERQNTEIGRQYRTAWTNYRTSVAAYRLEQQNIGYAKENLNIQKARFRVGIATTLETREAENSYVQALVRLYTAAYNLKVSETAVLQLEGKLVR